MAELSWIQKTDRLLECIQSIEESLNNDQFLDLLQLRPSTNSEGIHVRTMKFLLERSQLFIMKPTDLSRDLMDLGFSEEKADTFVRHWTNQSLKPILSRLECGKTETESNDVDINELTDLSWRLDVELVSSGVNRKLKKKAPIGTINLQINRDQTTNLQLDHSGLSQLFSALEEIQLEMDSIRTAS